MHSFAITTPYASITIFLDIQDAKASLYAVRQAMLL
jgi:hypothetical protein